MKKSKFRKKDFYLNLLRPIQRMVLRLLARVDLDKTFEKNFSVKSRPLVHRIFLVVFSFSATYMLGKIIALSLWPSLAPQISSSLPSPQQSINQLNSLQKDIDLISNNNLFRTEDITRKKKSDKKISRSLSPPTNLKCKDAKKKSTLPITLLTTIVLQDEVKSIASVQVRNKEKGLFNLRKGEEIPSLAEITKIQPKKLILKNKQTGQCEFIDIKKSSSISSTPKFKVEKDPVKGKKLLDKTKHSGIQVKNGNKFEIKKSLRNEMLSDMNEVLTQARAIQIKNPDGTLSFKIQDIIPGSIYSKLNIQNGDIITSINGKKFTNMNEIMTLFGQIREKNHYEIKMLRNGSEQSFEYEFK